MNYKRKKAVSLPTLSFKATSVLYLRINSIIYTGKPVGDAKNGARICNATNLDNGKEVLFLVPAVVDSKLAEMADYVGKCFEIIQLPKRENKSYRDYEIWEIECPDITEQGDEVEEDGTQF